jgi:protein-L-isoaspartate(D-aspartate) O-methyltransferase
MEPDDLFVARQHMVAEQIAGRGVRDEQVLEAMRTVPRHLFVPAEHRRFAYEDGPLPIGAEQTISQPYIVALMTELLELKGTEKVLEVGTGSGYQAAVLAYLAREVHTIERQADLARLAERKLKDLGLDNVFIHVGDGSLGFPPAAPYEAIIVTAGAPGIPPAYQHQLASGGRLVIPVGGRSGQQLERWKRSGDEFTNEIIAPVAFVPLIGSFGW